MTIPLMMIIKVLTELNIKLNAEALYVLPICQIYFQIELNPNPPKPIETIFKNNRTAKA